MSLEYVSSRINPKAIDFRHVFGGSSDLTPSEVAGMLAGMKPGRAELFMMLFCEVGEERSAQTWSRFYHSALSEIIMAPWSTGWKVPRPHFMERLLMIAVDDMKHPNNCPLCDGKGEGWFPGKRTAVPCPECNATGKKKPSPKAYSEKAEVSRQHWHDRWQSRYDKIYSMLSEWMDDVANHIAKEAGG